MATFNRLIRFQDENGDIHYGEAPQDGDLIGLQIQVYTESPLEAAAPLSESKKRVIKILSPIPAMPMAYGVGMNYRQHAEEGGVRPLKKALWREAYISSESSSVVPDDIHDAARCVSILSMINFGLPSQMRLRGLTRIYLWVSSCNSWTMRYDCFGMIH